MKLEETINNLQEYIDLDRKMRTSPIEEWSDFDKFCELHCRHIEKVLNYIKEESIPKAVVEEKIETLKQIRGEEIKTKFVLSYSTYNAITNEIDDLQEILNKGE